MRSPAAFLVFLSACLPSACYSQSSPPGTTDKYRNEPLLWENFDTTLRMRADGTGERIVHVRARLQSEGAARQFSVLSVAFASAYETASIDYIRVLKPDGTTIQTPSADAIEMPAPVTSEVPLYSDLKVKQQPVRSLAAGDVIEYQLRTTRTRAEVPGHFWGAEHFLIEGAVVLSQTLTLEVPASTYLQVWDPHHPTSPALHDGLRTYTWSSSQLKPTGSSKNAVPLPGATGQKVSGQDGSGSAAYLHAPDKIIDPDEDADGHKLPSVAWTTFHSWAEVGDWYRSLALSRSAPSPLLATRANELTRDAHTQEEQVRALYDFVSTRIRYVGIDFGVGRYQPHAAEEVLADQYGDCKDKDTLLEALLRAKGFTTAPALIGMDILPVPDMPSPALFNHVITTVDLSGGRIWLDTTPEVEPYRVLAPLIRDEQALVVPSTGVATLQRTPPDPPFPYFEHFEAVGSLDKDGLLKSHMDMTMRSDNEFGFRILVERAAPAQWDEAMQSVSRAMGFTGTVSDTDLNQKDKAAPVHLSYNYTRPAFADWDNHRILPLFPALEITYIDKDSAPDHDIDQGSPRTLEATTRITLPNGYRAVLPAAIHVKRDYATFDQTYQFDKGQLIVERKVVILKRKVNKAEWKDYYAYTRELGAESGENYISLLEPFLSLPTVASSKASTPGNKDTQAGAAPANSTTTGAAERADFARFLAQQAMLAEMIKGTSELEQNGKWAAAQMMLDEVKSNNPDYPYPMSMLGAVAQHDGRLEEATRDYEAELSKHREASSSVVTQLSSLYVSQSRFQDAEVLLRKYLDRNDVILFTALASAQSRSGDRPAALATLQQALKAHPHEGSIEAQLAGLLHQAHQN